VSGLELSSDERETAEHMSYLFGTEHYEVVLKGGDLERVMPDLAWHLEEPRVGQSYPNFYISRLAGKFVKAVLAGAGGDEFFGGYPWRYYRAVSCTGFEDYIDNYYQYWQRLVPNSALPGLFAPVWGEMRHVWTRDIFRDVFLSPAEPCTPEEYLNLSLYFEARTFLHGLLLVDDKLSQAHGLQVRTPFLDNDLVDFAMRLPARLKVAKLDEVVRISENEPGQKFARYFAKTNDGKVLLRRMLERHVPAAIANRVKQGFSAPDASWFRGDSISFVRRTLLTEKTRLYEFMDKKAVHSLLDDHLSGRENRRLFIWSLLSFEWWLRRFM
jgi:asparagine synthase (glutamine-hydrolysing)